MWLLSGETCGALVAATPDLPHPGPGTGGKKGKKDTWHCQGQDCKCISLSQHR